LKSIFHLITTIERGGAENQLLVLVKEQVEAGIEVQVAYLKGAPELETDFVRVGAKVHHDLANLNFYIQPLALGKIISRNQSRVHAHLPRAELVAFLTLRRFRLYVSRHNAEPFFPNAPRTMSNLLSRLVELRAERIIAISMAVKDFMVERGEVRNLSKVEVVHYGYFTHYQRKLAPGKPKSGILRLGTISRLSSQKDIPTMIRVFKKINDELPDSSLSILGSGSMHSTLTKLVSDLNLTNSVTFLGRSSRIYEYLAGLDVFLLTSHYEGFGMVLLEAMDTAIPIVASRNSAITEVMGSEFPGLCTTGDIEDFCKSIRSLSNPEYRLEVLALQESRLEIFTAKNMSKKIARIYGYGP